MTAFVILAAILLAGALLLIVPPMLGLGSARRAEGARQRQTETALVVLREQLAELEAEHTAGRITEAEYQRSRQEIERRALDEGRAAERQADARPSRAWAAMVVFALPAAAAALYLILGTPAALDPQARVAQEEHQIDPAEMAGLVAQLADRLEQNPEDVTGWLMLARSYVMLGTAEDALATWQRIGARAPDDADVQAEWADVLASAQRGDFTGEPDRLIARALQLQADNVKALALAGTAAYRRGDFGAASTHWERILTQVPAGDEARDTIVASINDARTQGGLPPLQAAPESANEHDADALPLSGDLSLSPELAGNIQPDEPVFVFVRAVDGGIPIAALRLRAADLPARFDFTTAPRMTEGALPPQVVVGARVSRHGDATARPGDLEGVSAPVAPDAQGVSIVIDRVRQ